MRDLVPLAHRMSLLAGGPDEGYKLALQIAKLGLAALGDFDDGQTLLIEDALLEEGVVLTSGDPHPTRTAELILVSDLLTQIPPTPSTVSPSGRLVFSSPAQIFPAPAERRLDLMVADIIRMASYELRIGSGFWNDDGIDRLLEVLQPAVQVRNVRTTLYAHPNAKAQVNRLRDEAIDLLNADDFRVRWYDGPENSLMHAKFVVADQNRGYLGTANLTSLGFDHHIEVGVELTPEQSRELVDILKTLESHGLFSATPFVRDR